MIGGLSKAVIEEWVRRKLREKKVLHYREIEVATGVSSPTARVILRIMCNEEGGRFEAGWCILDGVEKIDIPMSLDLYKCLSTYATSIGRSSAEVLEEIVLNHLSKVSNSIVKGCCKDYVSKFKSSLGEKFSLYVSVLNDSELKVLRAVAELECENKRPPLQREVMNRTGLQWKVFYRVLSNLEELGLVVRTVVSEKEKRFSALKLSVDCSTALEVLRMKGEEKTVTEGEKEA